MKVTCYPSVLSGTVKAIPSKSDAHRKLICAALSENGCVLPLVEPFCDDITATIRCLTALGAQFTPTADGLRVSPVIRQELVEMDCGESGSTLRFLLPVAMAVCGKISVTGHGRLPERPISVLTDAMSAHGVQFHKNQLPLTAEGHLTGGIYEIAGNISSQFLSGLLMALPLCDTDSAIRLTTPLQSSAYVDMTLDTLRLFGADIRVSADDNGLLQYQIKHGALHAPDTVSIDGDWSNAAFWLTAGAIQKGSTASITVTGLVANSTQGDREIVSILQNAGASVIHQSNGFTVVSNALRPFDTAMESIPDLLPILAVRAAYSKPAGVCSNFVKAERLRLKESDRLTATAKLLRDLGGNADEFPDGLSVYGGQLRGGTVDGMNDHRLVMAAAVAAICADSPVTILGAEAVNKSYPGFFDDLQSLGGVCVFTDDTSMNVQLIRANYKDAERIWRMQIAAFAEQYKRYQDHNTNPANEPLSKVQNRLTDPDSYYYIITADGKDTGGICVTDRKDGSQKELSPLFLLPEYQGKGIAATAVRTVEQLHGERNWWLCAIQSEIENLRFYEHLGYRRTGETHAINDKLTVVDFEK